LLYNRTYVPPLEEVRQSVEKLASYEGRVDIAELARVRDQFDATFTRIVSDAERAGEFSNPHTSHATLLAGAARCTQRAAEQALKVGRVMAEMPELAGAYLSGSVRPDNVGVIAQAWKPERAAGFTEVEVALVEAAKSCTPREMRTLVRRVCEWVDQDDGATEASKRHARRELFVSKLNGSGVLNGRLDPDVTETVITALEAAIGDDPDIPGDTKRTRPQRRADALGAICRHYLETRDKPHGHRATVQAGMVVDMHTLAGGEPVLDMVRADLLHMGSVSRATLLRLTCDCEVHRIITNGKSEVLDVGRSVRTVTNAQWRALVARDQRCTTAGCEVSWYRCQAHHKKHWAEGGESNLDNYELKCDRHHWDEHEGRRE